MYDKIKDFRKKNESIYGDKVNLEDETKNNNNWML